MIFKCEFLYLSDRDSRWQKFFNNLKLKILNNTNCRVSLSSTHPSVQHISSTQKDQSFSALRICQFNTKKHQFITNASVQHTLQFNTKKMTKNSFCVELTLFKCWTEGCVELMHLTCWTEGYSKSNYSLWAIIYD